MYRNRVNDNSCSIPRVGQSIQSNNLNVLNYGCGIYVEFANGNVVRVGKCWSMKNAHLECAEGMSTQNVMFELSYLKD